MKVSKSCTREMCREKDEQRVNIEVYDSRNNKIIWREMKKLRFLDQNITPCRQDWRSACQEAKSTKAKILIDKNWTWSQMSLHFLLCSSNTWRKNLNHSKCVGYPFHYCSVTCTGTPKQCELLPVPVDNVNGCPNLLDGVKACTCRRCKGLPTPVDGVMVCLYL